MNSREALDILDRLRPDDAECVADDVAAAREVVAADPELVRIDDERRAFDERVDDVWDDIPVPADLHGRLLGSLGLTESSVLEPETRVVTPAAEPTPASRRRVVLLGSSLVAGTMLAGLGLLWLWASPSASPTIFDYHERGVAAFDGVRGLPEFDGEYRPRLPWSGWERGRLRVGSARTLSMGEDNRVVAAYAFEVNGPLGPARGMLIAVPTEWLQVPPALQFFESGSATYTGHYASVAFVEREMTFICLVDNPATLERIERMLEVTAA